MQVIATFQTSDLCRSAVMGWAEFTAICPESDDVKATFLGFQLGYPVFALSAPLRGGKGGFGKLLKSQKNIGKKTDNFDSCRDLQGRRLRNANQEEKLRKFKELKDKEDEIVKTLQSSSANTKPVVALDEKYVQQLAQIEKQKAAAVFDGMKTASAPQKAAASSSAPKPKKLALFDNDEESISD